MFRVSCLWIWWRHNISISKMLKFDYLKNEKSFRSEIKSIFPCFAMLSFIHTKQTSKNVVDTTFKNLCITTQFYGKTFSAPKIGEMGQKCSKEGFLICRKIWSLIFTVFIPYWKFLFAALLHKSFGKKSCSWDLGQNPLR